MRYRSGLIVVAAALIATACSGSDEASDDTTTTSVVAAADTTAAPTTTEATTTTAAPTTTTSVVPEPTSTTRPRRGSDGADGGDPLPIPDPVPVTLGTATRYGVIGCSNTDQTVRGYEEISTKNLVLGGDLGGGALPRWGNPSDDRYGLYWALFDERRPADGYDGVWVQICLRAGEHGGVFDTTEAEWATHVVEQIRLRDPGVAVWVSPINSYVDGWVCTALGLDGPAIAAVTADWAATNLDDVFRGPDFGPLSDREVGIRDDCHPNALGEALLGQQLVEFIDQS